VDLYKQLVVDKVYFEEVEDIQLEAAYKHNLAEERNIVVMLAIVVVDN
jgi:hypothetical protein